MRTKEYFSFLKSKQREEDKNRKHYNLKPSVDKDGWTTYSTKETTVKYI